MDAIKDESEETEIAKVQALTRVNKTQIEFVWKIENFSFCSKKQEILESSTFNSDKQGDCLKWRLRLYTRGINEKYRGYMGLFLVLVQDRSMNKKLPKEVVYNFCILNSLNQKVNLVRSHESRDFKENDSWGFPKFLSKKIIETDCNNLVPNDRLTIFAEMCVYGHISTLDKKLANIEFEEKTVREEPKKIKKSKSKNKKRTQKPEMELRKTVFTDFLLNDKYSDLTIVTSDGKEIPAHRIILANESPVFMHKFDSLQVDNRLEMKNFDSQLIIDVLSYLYTGRMNFKSNLNKILELSDTYQLNELKNWCEFEMIKKITTSNLNLIPNYYLVANQCNAERLKDKIFEFFKVHFNKVTETDEWKQLNETHSHLINEAYKKILIDR